MSTAVMATLPVTTAATGPAAAPDRSSGRNFGRLLRVEFRKLVDTRAGLWLLIAMGVLAVALTFAQALIMGYAYRASGSMADRHVALADTATAGSGIMSTFVAILAILTIAGEWGQRTTLSTFALEPRRGRVLLAKVLVVVGVATLVWAISYPLAAAALAVTHAVFHASVTYSVTAAALFGSWLVMLIGGVGMGMGFGLLFLNSPAAIVTYLMLPMLLNLLSLVSLAWKDFDKVMTWTNPTSAQTPFYAAWHLSDFGPLATTTLIWVIVPAAIGTWRWMRRECK